MPAMFVLIWSTGFIVARYGMPFAPPMKFLVMRYALSVACFLPWIVLARVKWPATRTQWMHLAITGIFMHAGYLGGVWAAVKAGMGSGLSALIVGLQPLDRTVVVFYRQQNCASPMVGIKFGFFGLGHGGFAQIRSRGRG